MGEQTLIKEYKGIVSDIQTEIKKLENDTKVLNKLYVILDVLHDVSINDIAGKHGISVPTVYNWIKQWNEGGFGGLKRKKGSGGKSKLTDEQFLILDVIIQQMHLSTAIEVRHIIQEVFGVTYSIRQIERIMKKLNYSYTKPYQIYDKMPDDAEEQIEKRTNHLDFENYTVVFLDQTSAQNQENSQRSYVKEGEKNEKKQPTVKLSINSVGIQAINGNSFIDFLDNTKTFEMMKFMIKTTIHNIENPQLIDKLKNIINNEGLLLENILNTINDGENYNKLLKSLKYLSNKSKTFKILYRRVKKSPNEFETTSVPVLENLQKAMLLAYFFDKELQHELILEKPIAVILDNYSVHHAVVFKKLCDILNMDLIYLTPYSPKYNPIEQVWRTIKARLSREYITSMTKLKYRFKIEFMKVVDNLSFWDSWCEKFIWNYKI